MSHFVYILRSLKDNGYYVGMSADLNKHLEYHNKGRVNSTRNRKPFVTIYREKYTTRKEAREREKYLKSYQGAKEKLNIIGSI
tara:strand:+ start:325 stop:573 length:249 start_codon:yes stop_codon:yes gene_type:complete